MRLTTWTLQKSMPMQGTLDMLKKIVFVDGYKANDFFELQINAYEVLGQTMDVTLAYKNW